MHSTTRQATPRWVNKLLQGAALLVVANTAWVIGLYAWSAGIVQAPDANRPDAIAVLYSDFGPVLDRTARSLDQALALRTGFATPLFLCIGGNRHVSQERWGEAMAAYLLLRGVPEATIVRDTQSYDTRTNIRATLELARQHRLRNVTIVAHPAHAPRVLYHWRQAAGPTPVAIVWPLPAASPTASAGDFWLTAQHEALSWAGLLLPDAWEDRIIRWVRR